MGREAKECDHCEQPIVILPMVWGDKRLPRAYEAKMKPIAEVPERARYAYSQHRGGVVRLEHGLPADSPYLPAWSLVPHHCGRALRLGDYVEFMIAEVDKRFEGLGEPTMGWIKDGPAVDPRPWHERQDPAARRGIGFRRGLGRKPREEVSGSLERLREATTNISEPRNPPIVDEAVEKPETGHDGCD